MVKFRQGTTEECCRVLERYCPETWKRISIKRYQLPDYRVGDYPSQLALNQHYVRDLWGLLTSQTEEDTRSGEYLRQSATTVNLMLGLACNRPVYFLKPDHGTALMRTDLPSDLGFSDFPMATSAVCVSCCQLG
jgi:hypothetical protein